MFHTILLSAFSSFVAGAGVAVLRRARAKETDPTGGPVLRYLVAPYAMIVCGIAFSAFAISRWLDPTNHQYTGNLLLLSYVPAILGAASLIFAVHLLSFCATLTTEAIELYSWPLGNKKYLLRDLESIETRDQSTVVHFKHNKRFVVYSMYSGNTYFLSALSANNSFQRTRSARR